MAAFCAFAQPAAAQTDLSARPGQWSSTGLETSPQAEEEMEGLRARLEACWLEEGASQRPGPDVEITFEMTAQARPMPRSISLVTPREGLPRGSEGRFGVIERMILTCGPSGYGLPAYSHSRWQTVRFVFSTGGVSLP